MYFKFFRKRRWRKAVPQMMVSGFLEMPYARERSIMIRKRTTLTTSEKKQRLIFALFGVILVGAGLSVLWTFLQSKTSVPEWCSLAGCFFSADSIAALWMESVTGAALFLACLFLLGFSAIGQPAIILTLLCYGFCLGGSLQVQCSGAYAALRCVGLLPYYVPLSVLIVVAAREALRFAGMFTSYGFRDNPTDNMYHQFRMYCTRYAVLAVFLMLLGLLYSLGFYGLTAAGDTFR